MSQELTFYHVKSPNLWRAGDQWVKNLEGTHKVYADAAECGNLAAAKQLAKQALEHPNCTGIAYVHSFTKTATGCIRNTFQFS